MKKVLIYGGGLIALYLVTVRATGAGTLITDSTAGATNLVRAFQGR